MENKNPVVIINSNPINLEIDYNKPLPCREVEYNDIKGQVESALTSCTSLCIYVSGVPGTGKTETIRRVILSLRNNYFFNDTEINAMDLNGGKTTSIDRIQKYIASVPDNLHKIIVLDEIDAFMKRKSNSKNDLLYKLLNVIHVKKIIFIMISNTMDLPEKFLSARSLSRFGLIRLNFKPYSYTQLCEIIKLHLKNTKTRFLSSEAIEYCCRRIASFSGDARKAIDFVEKLLRTAKQEFIDLKEMIDLLNLNCIYLSQTKELLKIHVLILLDVIKKSTQAGKINFKQLIDQYWLLVMRNNLAPLDIENIIGIINNLAFTNCLNVNSQEKNANFYDNIEFSNAFAHFLSREINY